MTNISDNRKFFNSMPVGERDCEDGGMEGIQSGPSAKELAARAESARKAKEYNRAQNDLNARRGKEVNARVAAMEAKLGRKIGNRELDLIIWEVKKAITVPGHQ